MKRQITGHVVRADKSGPITFMASTPGVARDGMSIPVEAWKLDNYLRNPIVMVSHDLMALPVGRTVRLEKTREGLVADIEFDSASDPDAARVEGKVRRGYLNAVSVGFRVDDMDGRTVKEAELIEISLVAAPADVNAVALSRSAYQRTRRRWSEQSVCAAIGWKVPTASERELAVAMARFLNGGSMSGRHD